MEEVNEPVQLGAVSLEEIKQGAVTLEGIQLGGVTDDGIMISNLPLLFADGNPTCLKKFTVNQLEKFIPFMIKCSIGHHKGHEIPTPKWWPSDVSFSVSLRKPLYLDNARWLALLKSLVCRCYTYHGCEFMLRFCTELSAVSSTTLRYVNGWDGTTSLYNKHSGKLMVTFRNENRNYDTKPEFPRRSLLPKSQMPKHDIVIQPPVYDIYLCDNCDGEFDTLQDVKEHEKLCFQEEPNMSTRSASPEDLFPNNQQSFVKYFGLKSVDLEEEPNEKKSPVRQRRCKRRFPLGVTFTRGCAIPFSSPLGVVIHRKSRMAAINTQVLLDRMERYCDGKISQPKYRPKERELSERSQDLDWLVTWKPPLPKKGKEAWTHQYCFSRSKRKRKRHCASNPTELDRNSQELLSLCRPVAVVLRRLTTQEIAHYTQGSTSPTLMEYNPIYKCRLPKLLPNTVYTYSEHVGEYGGYGIEPSIPVIDLCSTDEEDDGEDDQPLLPVSDFTGNEEDASDMDHEDENLSVYEEGGEMNSEAVVYSNGYQYIPSESVTNWGDAVMHSVFSMQSSNLAYTPSLCVPTYAMSGSKAPHMEQMSLHKRLSSTSTQDASKNDKQAKLKRTALWLMQQKLPLSVRRLQQDECRELHRRGLNIVMSKCGRVLRSSSTWTQFNNTQFPNKKQHGRVVAVCLSDVDTELELISGKANSEEDYWENSSRDASSCMEVGIAAPSAHLLANYTSVEGLLTYSFSDGGLLMLTVGTNEKSLVTSINETRCKRKKKGKSKISDTKAVHMKNSCAYFTPVPYSKSHCILESKIKLYDEGSHKNTIKSCHLNCRNVRKDLKKVDKCKVTKVASVVKSANENARSKSKVLSFGNREALPMFGTCKNMGKKVVQNVSTPLPWPLLKR